MTWILNPGRWLLKLDFALIWCHFEPFVFVILKRIPGQTDPENGQAKRDTGPVSIESVLRILAKNRPFHRWKVFIITETCFFKEALVFEKHNKYKKPSFWVRQNYNSMALSNQ